MSNVIEDVADIDERYDLKLVRDRTGGGCGQRGNESEHFVKKDEVERSRDGVEIVGANLGEKDRRMHERAGDEDE